MSITHATSAAAETNDHAVTPRPSASSVISSATTTVQPAGPTPANDIAVNTAIPAREPVMSIAYARSGGIDLSRPPSGRASAAIAATTSANTPDQHPDVRLDPGLDRSAEQHVVRRCDRDVELGRRDQLDDHEEQQRERRQPRAGVAAAQDDPEADAEEARDQDEVREEAEVDDVRRDPADQEQLDEQHRRAGQEQAHPRIRERGHRLDQLPRSGDHPADPRHRGGRNGSRRGDASHAMTPMSTIGTSLSE